MSDAMASWSKPVSRDAITVSRLLRAAATYITNGELHLGGTEHHPRAVPLRRLSEKVESLADSGTAVVVSTPSPPQARSSGKRSQTDSDGDGGGGGGAPSQARSTSMTMIPAQPCPDHQGHPRTGHPRQVVTHVEPASLSIPTNTARSVRSSSQSIRSSAKVRVCAGQVKKLWLRNRRCDLGRWRTAPEPLQRSERQGS
jgi:hypothetical protein